MSFEPASNRHAIVKVLFVLQVTPGFDNEELDAIKNAHNSWKELLPAMDKIQIIGFEIGTDGQQPSTPPFFPASFTRYKPDGNLDLRLIVDNNNIIIECGSYSSWGLVWKNTQNLISKIADLSRDDNRKINSFSLQYTDEFVWLGEENYEVGNLLNLECKYIPPAIGDYGCAWHLHQGWFNKREHPIPGKTLERMNVSSSERNDSWIVQFENLNRYDVLDSEILLRTALSEENLQIEKIFDFLHDANKKLLGKFLNDQISKRIELNIE